MQNSTAQIANQLRKVHFGGNWTGSNLKDLLDGVDWQQATKQVGTFHSIATLVFHMNYYIDVTITALQGGPLESNDDVSFDLAPIDSEEEWQALLNKTWSDAETFAQLLEQFPENELLEDFADPKNGSHYHCFHGTIEHCYYHLGQIAMIKKMLSEKPN